jgi:bacteriocin biosynthesis cyclodehydratase domain-containing protein
MSRSVHPRVFLLTAGRIGQKVVHALEQEGIRPQLVVDVSEHEAWTQELFTELLERSEATIVGAALWRPYPDILMQLNRAADHKQLPWTFGLLDGTMIQVGPTVIPGETACYECFLKRFLTNSTLSRIDMALSEFYSRDHTSGHGGYLSVIDQLAAQYTALEITRLARNEPLLARGAYWYLDPFNHTQGHHPIVPVPWCRTCSRIAAPQDWSFEALSATLADTIQEMRDSYVSR